MSTEPLNTPPAPEPQPPPPLPPVEPKRPITETRPEILVGGAFLGGMILAKLIGRRGR